MDIFYKVKPKNPGCSHCGAGKTWVVVNVMSGAESFEYNNEQVAENEAINASFSFEEGRQALIAHLFPRSQSTDVSRLLKALSRQKKKRPPAEQKRARGKEPGK